MPERRFDALNHENREEALRYVPGYDWISGRFGPPPGIPKPFKDQLDKMSDRDYLFAVMKLSSEEKESLMISEAERRRTFTSHWPIWNIVDGYACAKEGFYYTGIIRNWERGDIPQESHKKFFSYCKMAQRKPCHNIPYDESDIPRELMTEQLSTSVGNIDNRAIKMNDLGIYDNRPKHHDYSVAVKRMETYNRYDSNKYPMESTRLSAAGFFYEGPADKVRCFWCDGALELWTKGDDPWLEHAKWYPGCSFVRQSKGVEFIKKARSEMTYEEQMTAKSLNYNCGDLSFLNHQDASSDRIEEYETYKICRKLGFDEGLLMKAYKFNDNKDFEDIQVVISALLELNEGKFDECERLVEEYKNQTIKHIGNDGISKMDWQHDSSKKKVNIEELLKSTDDPTEEESQEIVDGMRCQQCNDNMVGAVILPCGHFCICQSCSRINLPANCPNCNSIVKGACRAYLC